MRAIASFKVLGRTIRMDGLSKDTLRYIPATALPAVVSLISSAVFTRIFAPHSYGLLVIINAIIGPVSRSLSEVMGQPLGRFYSQMKEDGQDLVYSHVLRRFVRWVLFGGIACVLLIVGTTAALGIVRGVSLYAMTGAVLGISAQTMTHVLAPVLKAARDIRAHRRIYVGISLLGFLIPLGFIMILGRNVGMMVLGSAVASILMQIPLWKATTSHLAAMNHSQKSVDVSEVAATVRRFLRYGMPLGVWVFMSSMMDSSDRFVIGAYSGPEAVALYGTSYVLAAQALSVATIPLVNAMWPQAMRLWAIERATEPVRKFIKHATELYLMVGIGLTGGTAVIGKDIVAVVLGPGYQEGSVVMVPVMAGGVLWAVAAMGSKGIEIFERNDLMMWSIASATVVNFLLNLVLVPRFGWTIAAYTTVVGYGIYAVLTWIQAKRYIPWDIPWQQAALYTISAFIAWAAASFPQFSSNYPLFLLLIRGLIFVLGYTVSSVLLTHGLKYLVRTRGSQR